LGISKTSHPALTYDLFGSVMQTILPSSYQKMKIGGHPQEVLICIPE